MAAPLTVQITSPDRLNPGGTSDNFFGAADYTTRSLLRNSNSHLYSVATVVVPSSPSTVTLRVSRSTDGGATWADRTGLAIDVSYFSGAVFITQISYTTLGDKFFLMFWVLFHDPAHPSDPFFLFSKIKIGVVELDTVSETLTTTLTPAFSGGFAAREAHGGIAVKSNGDTVLFFMKDGSAGLAFAERVSGTWGASQAFPAPWDNSAGVSSYAPHAVEVCNDDRVRFFVLKSYQAPSMNQKHIEHVSWDGFSLGTIQTVLTDYFLNHNTPRAWLGAGLAYVDGGLKKYMAGYYTYDSTPAHDGHIISISINNPGSGFVVGENFNIDGGGALGQVDTVDGGGAVLTCHLVSTGTNYTSGTNVATFAWDAGVGLTVDIIADSISPEVVTGLVVKCLHANDDVADPTWTTSVVESNSLIETPGIGNTNPEKLYGTGTFPFIKDCVNSLVLDPSNKPVLFYAVDLFASHSLGDASAQVKRAVWSGSSWGSVSIFRSNDNTPNPTIARYLWGVYAIDYQSVKLMRWSGAIVSFTQMVEHMYATGFEGARANNYASAGGPFAARGNYASA